MNCGEIERGNKKLCFVLERASLRSPFLICAICILMTGTGMDNEGAGNRTCINTLRFSYFKSRANQTKNAKISF